MNNDRKKNSSYRFWYWTILHMLVALILCLGPISLRFDGEEVIIPTYIRLLDFKDGGTVTFLGLFVLWLYTFFFGLKKGLCFSIIYGILRYFVAWGTGEMLFEKITYSTDLAGMLKSCNPDILKVLAVDFFEFPVAYGIFAIPGLVSEKILKSKAHKKIDIDELSLPEDADKDYLSLGFLFGVLLQYIIYVIVAITCYNSQGRSPLENIIHCILYDAFGLLCEAAITYFFLKIPKVKGAICYLKHLANNVV